jgi:acetone carboxylase gamma subunit
MFNASVYAAFHTFTPDTSRGYRRWLGLSNVRDIR